MTSPPPTHPPSAAASGRPHYSIRAPERSAKTLGEILESEIKATDCVMLMCCYSKLGRDVLLMSPAQVPARVQTDGSAPPIMSKVNKNHLFLILLPPVSQPCSVMSVCRPRGAVPGLSGVHNSATLTGGRHPAFRCTGIFLGHIAKELLHID